MFCLCPRGFSLGSPLVLLRFSPGSQASGIGSSKWTLGVCVRVRMDACLDVTLRYSDLSSRASPP